VGWSTESDRQLGSESSFYKLMVVKDSKSQVAIVELSAACREFGFELRIE
jgi:hypothetical protein